mgnify:CR=1 FL=1
MRVKVHLYSTLRRYADGRGVVDARGTSVGECLEDLARRYPRIAPLLFDEHGALLEKVFVSINLESACRETASTPVAENDELYVILIVAGG